MHAEKHPARAAAVSCHRHDGTSASQPRRNASAEAFVNQKPPSTRQRSGRAIRNCASSSRRNRTQRRAFGWFGRKAGCNHQRCSQPCDQSGSESGTLRAALQPTPCCPCCIKLALRACVLASNKLALQRLKRRRNAPRPSKRDLPSMFALQPAVNHTMQPTQPQVQSVIRSLLQKLP